MRTQLMVHNAKIITQRPIVKTMEFFPLMQMLLLFSIETQTVTCTKIDAIIMIVKRDEEKIRRMEIYLTKF